MNKAGGQTREKIILAALSVFSEQGIRKASVDEIAYQAGVTRVTVYRYFSNKKELVRQAYLHVEQIFQKGLADLKHNTQANWESVMAQIGKDLSALPRVDVFARTDEIKRLYPDVYAAIQEVRVATLNGIFSHLFTLAERRGMLRPGLNRTIVQAVFWELVVNCFDNPRFQLFGLSDAELYYTMTDILRHGVFKNPSAETWTEEAGS